MRALSVSIESTSAAPLEKLRAKPTMPCASPTCRSFSFSSSRSCCSPPSRARARAALA